MHVDAKTLKRRQATMGLIASYLELERNYYRLYDSCLEHGDLELAPAYRTEVDTCRKKVATLRQSLEQ